MNKKFYTLALAFLCLVMNELNSQSITITNPNQGFPAPQHVFITSDLSDPSIVASSVQLLINNTLTDTDTEFPYHFSWNIPANGEYDIKVVATTDVGELTDEVHIVVGPKMSCQDIMASADDAKEIVGLLTSTTGPSLAIGANGLATELVGLRFVDMSIPQGAIINSAFIEFNSFSNTNPSNLNIDPCNLIIKGYRYDDAPDFSSSNPYLINRPTTVESVNWSPPHWATTGTGIEVSPDISTLVQEIVDRPGFTSQSAISFRISGPGRRLAYSFDGDSNLAPKLCVEYTIPTSPDADGDGTPDTQDQCANSLEPGSDCTDNNTNTIADQLNNACQCVGVPASNGTTISTRVASDNDDAEEDTSGDVSLGSSDLEMVEESEIQQVGLRFVNANIPVGATILDAHIQFTADEVDDVSTSLDFYGELSTNAASFQNNDFDISSRAKTTSTVNWQPAAWNIEEEEGSDQQSADLKDLLQEIINQPGYTTSSPIVILISGQGKRVAVSHDRDSDQAPQLVFTYSVAPPCADADNDGICDTDDNCPNEPGVIGSACDDNDPNTILDEVNASCQCVGVDMSLTTTISSTVSAGSDDAEEGEDGSINLTSTDLELIEENEIQKIGIRFTNNNLPANVNILDAYIHFTVDETDSEPTVLEIFGEANINPATFEEEVNNVSNRIKTAASTTWEPAPWTSTGDKGDDQRTANLKEIVQEMVNQPGYMANAALVFLIEGSGKRVAESFNGDELAAAELVVVYEGAPNQVDCPNLSADIGDPCDDGDSDTANDMVTADCECLGTEVFDCPTLLANVGDDCDDNNPNTTNDEITTDCVCLGESIFECPALQANIGDVCDDGDATTINDVVSANCVCEGLSTTSNIVCTSVSDDSDDAEELPDGSVTKNSGDLEMVFDFDGSNLQKIGIRFDEVEIPVGAVITDAYIQFVAEDNDNLDPCNLDFYGELNPNALTFEETLNNISSRPKTTATATWTPATLWEEGDDGLDQRTIDISAVIQEVIDQPDYLYNNPIAIIIEGEGTRVAESHNGNDDKAPMLCVTYDICLDGDNDGYCDDADPCPTLAGIPGSTCDDGDASTINDVIDNDCNCAGIVAPDCPNLLANVGDACDDGDADTENDVVTADCECEGTEILDCPTLQANIGDDCDDNNPNTTNDEVTVDCVCLGESIFDCPVLLADVGDDCDDNNPNTTNDEITADCVCLGESIFDCPALQANEGDVCDDGDATTINDLVTNACTCEGQSTTSNTECTFVSEDSDDAEELPDGSVNNSSSDLEMVVDGLDLQKVGIRFNEVEIPVGAVITEAYIQFVSEDNDNLDPCNLDFYGELSPNAQTFEETLNNISNRPKTTATATWTPATLWEEGDDGLDQRTIDISAIVQEVIDQPDYLYNNPIAILIEGEGARVAESHDGDDDKAPSLCVTYDICPDGDNDGYCDDADPCPILAGIPGSTCDDGDANTINDVIDNNCNCAGIVAPDCPNLSANVGDACDDGDADTENDVVTADCECEGTEILDCPTLQANIGDDCDDNNPNTTNDEVTADCVCLGESDYDCPALELNIGDTCDDGNAATTNDQVNANCECEGVAPVDCPALQLNIGDNCDDQDSNTSNDVVNADCECEGQPTNTGNTDVTFSVSHADDDAEEKPSGSVRTNSSDLELADDDGSTQWIGIRFREASIPVGAVIQNAFLQFTSEDNENGDPCLLTIYGEAADDAAVYVEEDLDISGRDRTAASTLWHPINEWEEGDFGDDQKSVDIAALLQEIIDRPGYVQNNAIAFLIEGSGVRVAESYDGNPDAAPQLIVSYDYTCVDDDNDGICNPVDPCPNTFGVPGSPCDDNDPDTYNDLIDDNCDCIGNIPTGFGCSRVAATNDDAEEKPDGTVNLTSSDLELAVSHVDQIIGLRFLNLEIPQAVPITSADIQFTVDESSNGNASDLMIYGEFSGNAAPFSSSNGNISNRVKTSTYLSWMPEEWETVNEAGLSQRTVDIAPILEEIVNHPDYNVGSAIVIIIEGSGTRTAESYDGDEEKAAELCVEYDVTNITSAQPNDSGTEESDNDMNQKELSTNSLHIFPNPAKDYLTLRFDAHKVTREGTIQVWDGNGRLVYNEKRMIEAGDYELRLENLNLPNGGYTVQLFRDPYLKAAKFVIYN